MEWYLKAMRQYADFSGRARRKEYWMYVLFYMIFVLGAGALGFMIGGENSILFLALYAGAALIHLIPTLAVAVRRLHDTGRSGWFYLIGFIPLIGAIMLLIWFCSDSQPGPNKWGPNPKDPNASGTVGLDSDLLDDIE